MSRPPETAGYNERPRGRARSHRAAEHYLPSSVSSIIDSKREFMRGHWRLLNSKNRPPEYVTRATNNQRGRECKDDVIKRHI
jgi:hypothetical protein